jgi:hypothetical protein
VVRARDQPGRRSGNVTRSHPRGLSDFHCFINPDIAIYIYGWSYTN